ncbi:MAG TPA: response regulator [Burkholderiaceae bacterium]|jgi:two-component system, sensor histidine kinase|nr:response regulator [Burkholderiaceae bacterium]
MNFGGKRRVVLIDDSGALEPALGIVLQQAGCETQRAGGTVDVAEVCKFSPDAILVDLASGRGPDGLDAVRRLREMPDLNHVVIAGLTEPLAPSALEAARSAGCARLFFKPIDADEVAKFMLSIDRRRHVVNDWPVERERRATMDRG